MRYARFPALALVLLMSLSCAAPYASPPPPPDQPVAPLSASILLLIPPEFEDFVYVSTYRDERIHHELGRDAVEQLRRLLAPVFRTLEIQPVRSEAEAADLAASGRYASEGFDFVAVPRFSNVDAWNKRLEFGFNVSVVLELYSQREAVVTKIRGQGESTTGIYHGATPVEGARLALRSALEAVRDSIVSRRDIFHR